MFAAEGEVTFSALEVKVGVRTIAVVATRLLANDLRSIDSVLSDNTSLFTCVTATLAENGPLRPPEFCWQSL